MLNGLILFFEYAAVLFYPLGQLGRISFSTQQINLYPYEIMLFFSLLFLFLKYRFSVLKKLHKNYLFLSIFVFLISLFIAYIIAYPLFNLWANMVGGLYLLRITVYLLYFVYFYFHYLVNRDLKKHIRYQTFFIIGTIICSSIFQYIFYPNLRNLLYQGWDPHLYRVFSFFFEPYLAGAAITLSLYFFYFHFFLGNNKKFLKYTILAVLFILLMLTFSRTVYIAALITISLFFLKKRNISHIFFLLVFFVLLVIVIPKPVGVGVQLYRTFSIDTRINNMVEGIQLWAKAPIFGIGYDRIRYRKAQLKLSDTVSLSHAAAGYHSSFITILVSGGIVGLICFVFLLFQLARISSISSFYILFLSILSVGDNALLHPFILFLLWKLLVFEVTRLWSK